MRYAFLALLILGLSGCKNDIERGPAGVVPYRSVNFPKNTDLMGINESGWTSPGAIVVYEDQSAGILKSVELMEKPTSPYGVYVSKKEEGLIVRVHEKDIGSFLHESRESMYSPSTAAIIKMEVVANDHQLP